MNVFVRLTRKGLPIYAVIHADEFNAVIRYYDGQMISAGNPAGFFGEAEVGSIIETVEHLTNGRGYEIHSVCAYDEMGKPLSGYMEAV